MEVVHTVVETVDVDSTASSLRDLTANLLMTTDAGLRQRLQIDGDDRFGVIQLDYSGEFHVAYEQQDLVTVALTNRGEVGWRIGEETGRSREPWLHQPGEHAEAVIRSAAETVVTLPVVALASLGRAMYGDDSFAARFIRATPGTPQLSRALTAGMRYAAAVASSDAFRSDLVRSSLYRFLAGLTIAAYGPAEEAAFRLHTAEARRRTFNAAARFIDDNAGRPITVDDVARAVGVATAELRDLFLGYHPRGMTPAGHLRSVRLAAAHEDLQRAAPGRGAAAVIARRWGYADLRAFATDYVRAYGVTPAWALKR